MGPARKKIYLSLVALIDLGAVLIALSKPARLVGDPGVARVLPDAFAGYRGQAMLFCQNEHCLRQYLDDEVSDPTTCPSCGSALDTVSLGENRVLPKGTEIVRRSYQDTNGRWFHVVVVLSGPEQKSIHRPEQCLPAQGMVIDRSETLDVSLSGDGHLAVKHLELRPSQARVTRNPGAAGSDFVYWFVSPQHETPDHLVRLGYMAADILLRNRAEPWAYVAVSTGRQRGGGMSELRAFLAALYPHLQVDQ